MFQTCPLLTLASLSERVGPLGSGLFATKVAEKLDFELESLATKGVEEEEDEEGD